MKLVEIKNNFAKIYYHPAEDELLISGFLTINDGNNAVVAQIISSESTNKSDTNCAVIKFSFNLSDNGSFVAYSGYVPSLDASIQKTEINTLKRAFAKKENTFHLGELVSAKNLDVQLGKKFFDNFVYIQSDRIENTQYAFNMLAKEAKPSLIIDTDGTLQIENAQNFSLTENFKLPVNFETLNYIYENDLVGLTVEQKAIVQDIVIEIQDYIKSEKSGFIPFSSLLSVVDEIYQADKSVGIILFRNKLIKYHQAQLFASSIEEFATVFNVLKSGQTVILKLQNAAPNWKKQALTFLINNVKAHLFINIDDEIISKESLAKIYQSPQIKPIISSKYNSEFASQLKSYAKNLILFAPEEVQKNYATYNSFLSKLNNEEYIISGAQTLFTPLILTPPKEIEIVEEEPEAQIVQQISEETNLQINEDTVDDEFGEIEVIEVNDGEEEVEEEIFEAETEIIEEETKPQKSAIRNIFEETVEAEIAKDVDEMFYSDSSSSQNVDAVEETDAEVDYNDMFSDEDLDMLDDLNSDEEDTQEGQENQEQIAYDPLEDSGSEIIDLENISEEDLIEEEPPAKMNESGLETKQAPVPNIPVYSTGYDDNMRPEETIKVAEGNIVYHAKYGRGVVEQIISYGKKTLCSIQFDNIGRRLLDPNLAGLKQA